MRERSCFLLYFNKNGFERIGVVYIDSKWTVYVHVYAFCRFDFVSNSQTAEILFSDHSLPRLSVHYQRKFNPLSAEK